MSNKRGLDTFSNTNLADMLEDFQCRTVVIAVSDQLLRRVYHAHCM